MSEPGRDTGAGVAWVTAVAGARGVDLADERAGQVAAAVAPTLEAFRAIAAGLAVDDDMYEFRRLIASEAAGA
jgi:hypothetical protein